MPKHLTADQFDVANGVPQLDGSGKLPTSLMPDGVSSSSTWNDVRAHGAMGDGTTDDTAAIQATINLGGPTYFPPGLYLSGRLNIPLGAVLIGANDSTYAYPVPSTSSSTIKLKNGTNDHLIYGAPGASNVQILNLAFDGNKANNTLGDVIRIDTDTTGHDALWYMSHCFINNAPANGVYVGLNRQGNKFDHVIVMQSGNNGWVVNGSDTGLFQCGVGLSVNQGVYVGGWVARMTDCDIWSNGGQGVLVDGAQMVSIVGCGIDRNSMSGLYVSGSANAVSVSHCHFHSNSQSGDNAHPNIQMNATGELTVVGTTFGTDSLTNAPSNCIETYSGTLHEFGNILISGAVRGSYLYNSGASIADKFFGDVTANSLTVKDSATVPATPSGGAILFSQSGIAKIKQSDSTVIPLTNTGVWLPSDNNLVWGSYNPFNAGTTTSPSVGTVAGKLTLQRVILRSAATLTNILFGLSSVDTTGPISNSYLGVYDSTGTLVASTPNISSTLMGTATAKSIAFNTPYNALAGEYFIALLLNGTWTSSFNLKASGGGSTTNSGLAAPHLMLSNIGSSLSSLPSSITLSSQATNLITGGWGSQWYGLS